MLRNTLISKEIFFVESEAGNFIKVLSECDVNRAIVLTITFFICECKSNANTISTFMEKFGPKL